MFRFVPFLLFCLPLFAPSIALADENAFYVKGVAAFYKRDYKNALQNFTIASSQGDKSSQCLLGVMYAEGVGVAQDYEVAFRLHSKVAEECIFAQYSLGFMYSNGKGGVSQDYKEALKWYRKGAERGHSESQLELALMYVRGDGVIKDNKEAMKWFLKSAEQGNDVAQNESGMKYAMGQGVVQDNIQAHMWFTIAALNGNANGKDNINVIEKRMSQAQISESQKLTKKWIETHK
ncbi:MAG: sel1 repeat family protein [Nitrospinota bacterium]|nr:sel1 repeat family protein [Nitrospinota bacterium]